MANKSSVGAAPVFSNLKKTAPEGAVGMLIRFCDPVYQKI